MSYKWYFGKKFIGNHGNELKMTGVDGLCYRGSSRFYGVTLKISVVGKYPGSDWANLIIIGGTQKKGRIDHTSLWGTLWKRRVTELGSGQPHVPSL